MPLHRRDRTEPHVDRRSTVVALVLSRVARHQDSGQGPCTAMYAVDKHNAPKIWGDRHYIVARLVRCGWLHDEREDELGKPWPGTPRRLTITKLGREKLKQFEKLGMV